MLDPKQLKAIKKSAQREQWSAVDDAVVALSAQASGKPVDIVRIKSLVPVIQGRNREDLCWAVDELLRIQNRLESP
jgi:hypothetical protein